MKYKLIIADVDGTLIAPTAGPAPTASPKVVEAVRLAQEKGVIFTLGTARSWGGITALVESLSLTGNVILDNGALIYDCKAGVYIWEKYLDPLIAQHVLDTIYDPQFITFVVDNQTRIPYTKGVQVIGEKISKILILSLTPETADAMVAKLAGIEGIQETISVSGEGVNSRSVHITHSLATKGVATRRLAEILNIRKEEIIGIGDSNNDLPLLEASGLKVAMDNAVEEMKRIADYIAPSYEQDGVAHVIEKFILHETS